MKRPLNKFKIRPIGFSISVVALVWAFISFFLGKSNIGVETYFFLTVLGIVISISMYLLELKNVHINNLIESISEGTAGILASYDRIAKMEKDSKYLDFAKQYVRYEEHVIGVQTYNYFLSSEKGKSSIKIEYQNGYIEDNKDINALIQGHYNFKKSDIVRLRKAIYKSRIIGDVTDLQNFFFNKFKKINPEKGTNLEENELALLSIAQEELSVALEVDLGESSNGRKLKKLKTKRWGIAKAILTYELFNLSTNYRFSYNGKDKIKDNRRYISYIVESITGLKKIYLIVYRSDFQNAYDIIALEDKIVNSFKHLLQTNGLVEGSEDLDDKKRSDLYELTQKFKQNF